MMPSPAEVAYPEGQDCSKCKFCLEIKLGKVDCSKCGLIDPDLSGRWPAWPIEGCPLYYERDEFKGVL